MIPDLNSDPHSAEELLRRAAWTRRLARSLLADDAEAEDVAQDVWLAASRRPPRATEPLEPWLHTVVRNRIFNLTRERRRRQDRERRAEAPAASESPEAMLARLELHKLLVDVVGQLTEPYRVLILLRYFEGLSSAEIGARQNLPPGTVRGRLRTALELLREALDRRLGARAQWTAALTEFCSPRPSTGPAKDASAPSVPPAARTLGRLISAGKAGATFGAASLAGVVAVVSWSLAGPPTTGPHEAASLPVDEISFAPHPAEPGTRQPPQAAAVAAVAAVARAPYPRAGWLMLAADESVGARRPDPRLCRIATTGRGPVVEACKAGGVVEAKKLMKRLVKQARVRDKKFTCYGCHRDLDDWTLLDGARDRLDTLLAAVDLP